MIAGNDRSAAYAKRLCGIGDTQFGGKSGQCFAEAHAVRAAAPGKFAIAKLLAHIDFFGGTQRPRVAIFEKTARVVLLGGTAALNADRRKANRQRIRCKHGRLALLFKGHVFPGADIQPTAHAARLYGSVEFEISALPAANLGVDAQHGSQRRESFGQQRAEPILFHAVGHDELFDLHGALALFSSKTASTPVSPLKTHGMTAISR